MLEAFSRPRIEGGSPATACGPGTSSGAGSRADVVIENSYADVKNAVISAGASEIAARGLFSLGYPRKDGGEQINAASG